MASEKYNYNKLASKHVLVFGGTSGIGFAVAKAALAASASVTISSSSTDRIASTLQRLQAEFPGAKAQGYSCNLALDTVEEEIEQLFAQIPGGSVDHIIYTAADALAIMPIEEMTREKIVAGGQLRFVAPMLVAKIGSRYLTAGPYSSITLTSGTIWEHPHAEWTVVSGYMGGVCSIARNLALDLKPIRVNAVSPGLVDTELWDPIMPANSKKDLLQEMASKQPTGRLAKPEDIAEAYMYLMKDPNITGRIISTDSGSLLI